jgi:hypothetical protein
VRWEQRRASRALEPGLAASSQEAQDAAPLLPAGRDDSQGVRGETAAPFAFRAAAGLTPQYCVPQRPLCRIVSGFHPFNTREGPQCGLERQDLPASARCLCAGARCAGLQPGPDPGTQLSDVAPEGRAAQRAVPDPIPPGEQVLGAAQQLLADRTAGAGPREPL